MNKQGDVKISFLLSQKGDTFSISRRAQAHTVELGQLFYSNLYNLAQNFTKILSLTVNLQQNHGKTYC